MNKKWGYSTSGIPDKEFIRGNVPMTKEEIRAIVMGKLRLEEDSLLVDVGAGTGSVSIEAALRSQGGKVLAIECKEEAINLINKNKEAFGVENLIIHKGRAGEIIKTLSSFNRIFIGGSGGEMEDIIKDASIRLSAGGRIVITSVTIESTSCALNLLKEYSFEEIDLVTITVARGKNTGNYTLMEGQNPITILSATRGNLNEE
ncbi:precorrin-6Y C5,15-methyltransferase (decarboxylating) subunit CbiT [Alkaliphilus peptidifermentans]|uniref:Cobalt-precorrin-6B (C15)-methyltransferase n=1 Tax=Alkaliphilus peptidifermentans DSM 18978 TaxID=1120976 RepID=A0A1G5AQJ9_9FIRM|nr:precorrin-6Y C5,15-methyltransferase (decarboxylating) subunit CbiT [Alkaliphilus peptidifermentans]SCX80164.1 cobalt-precorrin-6B (C15)-methyltransferase [Alkaliphilus peptidifermentans DSM 18978]